MAIIRKLTKMPVAFETDIDRTTAFLQACLAGDREGAGQFISMLIRRNGGAVSPSRAKPRDRPELTRH